MDLPLFRYPWRYEFFIDKYDLQNDHLEVKKVKSAVYSYVSDIKIVEMESPCGFTPISVPMTVGVL